MITTQFIQYYNKSEFYRFLLYVADGKNTSLLLYSSRFKSVITVSTTIQNVYFATVGKLSTYLEH